MKQAINLLEKKGRQVWSVTPESTVLDAIALMAEKRIGALLVMEEDRLDGVFSERDYARKVVLDGKSSRSTAVREIMTNEVVIARPENTVDDYIGALTWCQ